MCIYKNLLQTFVSVDPSRTAVHNNFCKMKLLHAKNLGEVWKIQKRTTHNANLIFDEI